MIQIVPIKWRKEMNFTKAVEHLDGLAVANMNEPSEGDLERVLKNQSKFKARVKELEKAIENLSHAVSCTNTLSWSLGEPEPYLLEAAKDVVRSMDKGE